ncbi:adenine phosphoribosyltransferase [Arthrobacter zhaoxinii]|uniref:Adenine phosphoribosyltransferase n=1 Tax=Arthrobacter zhaoxinii TaxID=2964616 RepID=A0ABY5YVD6_9MICC|nr:adenine phosphoribosyltransferase [Arthrobacter zhaoxinii]MCQ2001996.1 adenine phosphoribosyltransferase [Arthrobacter zhaoxinii]UWX98191.1 adenine phosphoribosyltransferase [Arthrobacter zhaoxinii]
MKDAPAEPDNHESIEQTIERLGAVIPDYPKPGIVFRDLTPVFADGPALRGVVDALIAPFEGQFDFVAGVEARGFLLAAAAAYASGKGVITVRKPGKLPREVFSESYSMEYGDSTLELHRDDMPVGSRVLILDDVLATGGTLGAAARLIRKAGAEVAGFGVVLELGDLGGRDRLGDTPVTALIRY